LPARPDRLPDRRLRAGATLRRALARRHLRGAAERRPAPTERRRRRPRGPRRVRGAARSAQGAAGAAQGVAGAPPAHRRAAAAGRRRPTRRPAPARPAARLRRGDRRARLPAAGRADGGARPRQGARRAVDRDGELRHGADPRLRVRPAGGRLGHPGLPRRDDAGHGRARSAGRSGAPRRREPRLGAARGSVQVRPVLRLLGASRLARLALALAVFAGVAVALWLGPAWGTVGKAFQEHRWQWVVVAIGINHASIVTRSIAWTLVIDQALQPPRPRYPLVFSAFCVGLLANAALPGRIGELARVAVLTRRMARRRGVWATLVGTVVAHRMFDLVPIVLLILYVLVTAKIPAWAYSSLVAVVSVGATLFLLAVVSARRPGRVHLDGAGTVR